VNQLYGLSFGDEVGSVVESATLGLSANNGQRFVASQS
jgi:hypothetical protein